MRIYVINSHRISAPAYFRKQGVTPVFFSEEDAYVVHFLYSDALVMAIHIGGCKVSKILVDRKSSVNNLYKHILNRMEDTPKLAQKMIISQTQSLLYADPYNNIMEFCILDVESYNAILERPWIHMMREILSTHHQLMKYPTPSGLAN